VDAKERAGEWAASQVEPGMAVGLGTGSTAEYFTRALARRVREEGLVLRMASSSSHATTALATGLGLTLTPLEAVEALDLYADGADEWDPGRRLIKGRGGAMVREKHLVHLSARFLVLVDPSKRVDRLGTNFPVPVEVFPFAALLVRRDLERLGAAVTLRPAPDGKGPCVTDQGCHILDARFNPAADVAGLDGVINAIPGVVGHGLFTRYADRITVAVGHADRVEVTG
jgi:ribose 5-phosphate isomerase A